MPPSGNEARALACVERLRYFKQLCGAPLPGAPSGIAAFLFVCGVDGRRNRGSHYACRFLLEAPPTYDLRSASFPRHADALEEAVLIITAARAAVFHADGAPLGALSLADGVVEYTLTSAQRADGDLADEAKLLAFRSMIDELVPEGARIGVTPDAGTDPSDAELWPLLSAYAGDPEANSGFLSLRNPFCDAWPLLERALSGWDARTAAAAADFGADRVAAHFLSVQRILNRGGAGSGRSRLSEAEALAPLALLEEAREAGAAPADPRAPSDGYGKNSFPRTRGSAPGGPLPRTGGPFSGPRVLFGAERSALAAGEGGRPAGRATVGGCGAAHGVVEFQEPCAGLKVCRTVFFTLGGVPKVMKVATEAEAGAGGEAENAGGAEPFPIWGVDGEAEEAAGAESSPPRAAHRDAQGVPPPPRTVAIDPKAAVHAPHSSLRTVAIDTKAAADAPRPPLRHVGGGAKAAIAACAALCRARGAVAAALQRAWSALVRRRRSTPRSLRGPRGGALVGGICGRSTGDRFGDRGAVGSALRRGDTEVRRERLRGGARVERPEGCRIRPLRRRTLRRRRYRCGRRQLSDRRRRRRGPHRREMHPQRAVLRARWRGGRGRAGQSARVQDRDPDGGANGLAGRPVARRGDWTGGE